MPGSGFSSPPIQVNLACLFLSLRLRQKLMDSLRMVSEWKVWDFNEKSIKLFAWRTWWWTFEAGRVPWLKINAFIGHFYNGVLLWLAETFMNCDRTFLLMLLRVSEEHCIPTEPMGAKPPTFSSEGSMVTRQAAHSFGLLCQAQGYPVPSFR